MQNLSYSPFLLPHCVQNTPIPSLTVRQTLHCMPVYLPVGPDVMRDGVFRKHGWFRRGFTPSVGGWPLKTTTETALCKPFLKSGTTSDHLRNLYGSPTRQHLYFMYMRGNTNAPPSAGENAHNGPHKA